MLKYIIAERKLISDITMGVIEERGLIYFKDFTKVEGHNDIFYIKNEHSFLWEHSASLITCILVGYIYLMFDDHNKFIGLDGFCPINFEEDTPLVTPNFEKKDILLRNDDNYDTYRIRGSEEWKRYFNHETGWICIGNPEYKVSMKAVQNRSDCGLVFEDGILNAIWIKAILI